MANLTTKEEIVGLKKDIEFIKNTLEKMSVKLDNVLPTFVTQPDHNDDIAALRKEINDIKGRRWVQNTLSAILGAVLTLLVSFFISNVGR